MDASTEPLSSVAPADLNSAVERYYDTTLDLYETLWSEHVHHGYWDSGDDPATGGADRGAAADRLVRMVVEFAGVRPGSAVFDAGCGIGGPALYLAGELGCPVDGVTLSGAQALRAEEKAAAAGLAERTRFRKMDALRSDYPDGTFDVVWAMESLEHMPDRAVFYAEALRLLRPGGTLAVSTWCVRDGERSAAEEELLGRILHHQVLPSLISLEWHESLCWKAGFTEVRTADWSSGVGNSWDHAFAQVAPPERGRRYMMDLARERGVGVLGFFYAGPLMLQGYRTGLMRYGVLRATRPA